VGVLYHKLYTQSSVSEDGRNYRPKYAELIGIINKPLLLHLVGCLYYYNSDARSYKHQIDITELPFNIRSLIKDVSYFVDIVV